MNWIVFHVASGQVFFTGAALVILAAIASTQPGKIAKRVTGWALVLGLIGVVISSTPLPLWCVVLMILALVAWIAGWFRAGWRRWAPWTLVAAMATAAAAELPWHFMPRLRPGGTRELTVIGDSVSAGVGGNEESQTWPVLIAERHALVVQDLSEMGETAASALKRLETEAPDLKAVVLVEIGGNDLMGSTTANEFAADLDRLLERLAVPGRQLVMFELPLPPFRQEFGRAQRRLATKHGVALVPKRVFLHVIAGGGATLDSVHLSQDGHAEMARTVWELTRVALDGR